MRTYNHGAIINPNTSGQGYAPSHRGTMPDEQAAHAEILYRGYVYSHSTRVYHMGEAVLHHCYKRADHNVSWYRFEYGLSVMWDTSCPAPTGRYWAGKGLAELRAHLRSKGRRYAALKGGR